MPPTTGRQRVHERGVLITSLPIEVIERILAHLPLHSLAAANATSRLFRGAPGSRSPVENALRERASRRGHVNALPVTLPRDVCTWTGELIARERVVELARAHAHVVACGSAQLFLLSMSAMVSADGGLHTCGEDGTPVDDDDDDDGDGVDVQTYHACAALGHADAHEALVPTRVASLASVRVRAVSAGYDHLLALSDIGAVYACGHNDKGQLGLGDRATRRTFAQAMALAHEVVICITGGSRCSFALTVAGRAYSWGNNFNGQLGHGDTQERWEPRCIEALGSVRVAGASVDMFHVLFLAASGAVYSCGRGDSGRLGHGDAQHQRAPKRIEALAGVRAVHVSVGLAHSLVVDSAGGVHSFGHGGSGCLGHGGDDGGDDGVIHLVPKRIKALASVRAVRAIASSKSSAVLGADGSVHVFGANRCAQLGIPRSHGHYVERPTCVGALGEAPVVDRALGWNHALFVTADGRVHSCGEQSAALGHGVGREPNDLGDVLRASLTRVAAAPLLLGPQQNQ